MPRMHTEKKVSLPRAQASSAGDDAPQERAHVVLVGAGVVGRAIMNAHLDVGAAVTLADQDPIAIEQAIATLSQSPAKCTVKREPLLGGTLHAVHLHPRGRENNTPQRVGRAIVIESIAERLEAKRAFFHQAESWFGPEAILCSNTSTIPLSQIGSSLEHPSRFCGMHFFMPVEQRPAVEVIRAAGTDEPTVRAAQEHARWLNKEPLLVADSPGFVVNRMLAPYLNQAMLLLCSGVSAERIEVAARAFGMPMSPLELIDWIGARTAFDAGRVYWQAFPGRIDPCPLIAAMVKRGRAGRGSHGGFYDYVADTRSPALSEAACELASRYHREVGDVSDTSLIELLAIPMWIEGEMILDERVVEQPMDLETAMAGGLGYQPAGEWLAFYDRLGLARVNGAIAVWSSRFRSMSVNQRLQGKLAVARAPSDVMRPVASTAPRESLR